MRITRAMIGFPRSLIHRFIRHVRIAGPGHAGQAVKEVQDDPPIIDEHLLPIDPSSRQDEMPATMRPKNTARSIGLPSE